MFKIISVHFTPNAFLKTQPLIICLTWINWKVYKTIHMDWLLKMLGRIYNFQTLECALIWMLFSLQDSRPYLNFPVLMGTCSPAWFCCHFPPPLTLCVGREAETAEPDSLQPGQPDLSHSELECVSQQEARSTLRSQWRSWRTGELDESLISSLL